MYEPGENLMCSSENYGSLLLQISQELQEVWEVSERRDASVLHECLNLEEAELEVGAEETGLKVNTEYNDGRSSTRVGGLDTVQVSLLPCSAACR